MDLGILVPIIAVSIPLAAICANPVRRWLDLKDKQMALAATTAGENAAQYAAKIERLESRVQVLERIATDRGPELAHEIERLRTLPLN